MPKGTFKVKAEFTQEDLDRAERLARINKISKTDAIRQALALNEYCLDEVLKGNKILVARGRHFNDFTELVFNDED